jgi:linoleoyl-CoA desaturase
MIVMKIVYVAYAIVLPLLVLDVAWYWVVGGFIVGHLVAGLILTVIFQLAHVIEDTEHPVADENGVIENSWFVHQIITTANFSVNNKLLTWYCGGLNYQVEHHLFPKICSIHYPKIAPIVKETAAKYHIPYHDRMSIWESIASHYQTLKKLSVPSEPAPKTIYETVSHEEVSVAKAPLVLEEI